MIILAIYVPAMSTFIISTVGVMHDEIDDLSLEFDTLHCPFPYRDSIYPYFCLALCKDRWTKRGVNWAFFKNLRQLKQP